MEDELKRLNNVPASEIPKDVWNSAIDNVSGVTSLVGGNGKYIKDNLSFKTDDNIANKVIDWGVTTVLTSLVINTI